VTKRFFWSAGNLLRSAGTSGLRMRVPWQGAHVRA